MTKKLYERDSYIKEFDAEVIFCEEVNGKYQVVLDQTAFFPEGGGQAADEGKIEGANVLDVQIKDGIVTHTVDQPFIVGNKVHGAINWPVRFARMQNHTGEHMLSGTIYKKYGYENVGFHMGHDMITVDTSGKLSEDQIRELEMDVNQLIYENHPVKISFPTVEELRVMEFRSKIEIADDIRIVDIIGVDVCACCAPHVAGTAEVGLIKILNAYPNKGGTRIEMLSGIDAFRDYCKIHEYNKDVMKILSAKRDDVADAVQKSVDALGAARFENKELKEKLTFASLEEMEIGGMLVAFAEAPSFDEMRGCSNALLEKCGNICLMFSNVSEDETLYIISSKETDIRPFVKELNGALNGRGGGKEHFAQGKAAASKEAVITYLKSKA